MRLCSQTNSVNSRPAETKITPASKGCWRCSASNRRLHDADGRQQRRGRQRGVHDEAQKRVHEQKAVILQQDQQGQWQAGVMQRGFLGPRQLGVGGAEMRERNGEQEQAHGAGQPRTGRAVLLAPFEDHREDGEGGKADGHHQQRGVVQGGQWLSQSPRWSATATPLRT